MDVRLRVDSMQVSGLLQNTRQLLDVSDLNRAGLSTLMLGRFRGAEVV